MERKASTDVAPQRRYADLEEQPAASATHSVGTMF
jgi:hypothetical protein